MASRSIFNKTCPACAAVLPLAADCCACGHRFEAEDIDSLEQTAAEEELFETYLSARLDQALESLETARAALAAMPGDFGRASLVMQRVIDLQMLRGQLEMQRAKTGRARDAVDQATDTRFADNEAFRAAQAARAERVAQTASRSCPHCRREVARAIEYCECGYHFPAAATAALDGSDPASPPSLPPRGRH